MGDVRSAVSTHTSNHLRLMKSFSKFLRANPRSFETVRSGGVDFHEMVSVFVLVAKLPIAIMKELIE